MSKEIQEKIKNIIRLYSFKKNILRFIFFEGHDSQLIRPTSMDVEFQLLRDPEGKIQSKKKNFHLIFDPPTGNIRLDIDSNILFNGKVSSRLENDFFELFVNQKVNLYGLGAVSGSFERNTGEYVLRNIDTFFYSIENQPYASFPFILVRFIDAEKHFAILMNTSYPLKIHIQTSKNLMETKISFSYYYKREISGIDFFIFFGTFNEIYKNYLEIAGKPFLPPIWSIGYHQSRWSYRTQKRVLEIAAEARKNNLPLDAIYLDIHYMNKYKVFTWNERKFPNPFLMNESLKKVGIRTVAIVDPGVAIRKGYSVYEEGVRNQYFCKNSKGIFFIGKVWPGRVHFPDFTRNEVREWWSDLHKVLFEKGVDGIWNDMNEPVLEMGKTDEPLKYDIQHKQGSHLKIRNLYANLEAESTHQAFLKFKKNERHFILSRSGTVGLQKFSALWTGDNHTSWKHLRENLYMVINLNLSGMYFCGADVGGFGSPSKGLKSLIKLFRDSELFERWIELGSLMPFFRNHTTLFSFDQEPWRFNQVTFYRVKKHIFRRYQLLLYIYYQFYKAYKEGSPIIYPVFYFYPELEIDDSQIKDQFFIGNSLLACPVLYPSQNFIKVYLPPGNWYDFEYGKLYRGNQFYDIKVERGYFPLFVKSGTAIPIALPGINAEATLKNEIFIEIYPDNFIEGFLYLDDGISRNFENQNFFVEIKGSRDSQQNIKLEYKIISQTFQPHQSSIKIRIVGNYKEAFIKKRKINSIKRDLFSENRKFIASEFEFPIREDWEADFLIDKS